MAKIYDGKGNVIELESKLDVTEYALFEDNDGNSSRQAILTYYGKRLYPKNYPSQRLDFVKKYDSGVMIALGDSYTAMGANYFSTFAETHGLAIDNRGLASSTIAGSQDKVTVGYHAFWVRLDEAIAEYQSGYTINEVSYICEDVKLITFMGGANDWYTVDEAQGIDRLGDVTSENKEQLYGACKYIFDTLLATFPNADIVVILQPSNKSKGNYEMHLKESIIKECANMYGLPICDCIFEWYNPSNPTENATYWVSDELHLSDSGYTALFDKLEKVVNNLPIARN